MFGRKSSQESGEASVEELYKQARRNVYGPVVTRRKLLFAAVVLALGFAIVWLYQSGLWAKAPFVQSLIPPPSEEEIVANLSVLYGRVDVMTVKGNSMFPNLVDGQKVFVATDYYKSKANLPRHEDVVAISFSTIPDQFIKRVVFAPQDSIAQDGSVFYLNESGKRLNYEQILESNLDKFLVRGAAGFQPRLSLSPDSVLYRQLVSSGHVIPNGTVVVLGDNPSDSVDSRSFGLVIVSELSGKVVK